MSALGKSEYDARMIEIITKIYSGNKEAAAQTWRKWGNGPHWDFPTECNSYQGQKCSCGHHQ